MLPDLILGMHHYQFFQNEYDTNTFIFGTCRLQITETCIFIAFVILLKKKMVRE